MQNRKLILITIIAIGLAVVAAQLAPRPWDRRRLADPVIASATAPLNPKLVPSPAANPIAASPNPTDQILAQLRDILAQDPTDETDQAANLLNDLCAAGQFETALKTVDIIPGDMRPDWLNIIFNRWSQTHPRDAMKALDTIQDPDERAGAFQAAVAGWNATDPAGLADFAIHLDATGDRDYALALALNNWSLQDPTALATWLNTLPRGGEFDFGIAMMLAKTDGANRTPELAMQWVENINDPALKQNSFARVLAQWLQSDTVAAKQYVTTATWLDDTSRSKILTALSTPPP
jgi:hypothetical protein